VARLGRRRGVGDLVLLTLGDGGGGEFEVEVFCYFGSHVDGLRVDAVNAASVGWGLVCMYEEANSHGDRSRLRAMLTESFVFTWVELAGMRGTQSTGSSKLWYVFEDERGANKPLLSMMACVVACSDVSEVVPVFTCMQSSKER